MAMSRMPGSFARQGDEPEMELELSVTESEYDPSGAESEMSIGEGDEDEDDAVNGLFMEEDDDDEDDDDDDDVDYEDGEGQFADFELDIDEDEYGDPELAEAERLASAASALGEDDDEDDGEDDDDDGNATETETPAAAAEDGPSDGSYSVAVDSVTGQIYLVDSNGVRSDILSATEEEGENPTGNAAQRMSRSSILATLRRIIGARTGRTAGAARVTAADDDDDDDDDDEDGGSFPYGFRGGRRSAEGMFPVVTEPIKEGQELERNGLFGRPGIRYKRRFSGTYHRNVNDALRDREYRSSARPYKRGDIGDAIVPNSPGTEVAKYPSNVYCGQYSKDGSFFYTCAQDYRIRIYDMTSVNTNRSAIDRQQQHDEEMAASAHRRGYRRYNPYSDDEKTSLPLMKSIQAPDHLCNWTITDANLSPDNTRMIWSSISPVLGMAKVKENEDAFDVDDYGSGSVSLDFNAGQTRRRQFGIWSIRFSADGKEIVAGSQHGYIFVYDVEARRPILSIPAHQDDVNAVCFADTESSNILVSGSDDSTIKVWDRRSLGDSGRFTRPSGHLIGHTEGITYVAPKGDGRFVVSNGKDQTCKLWDLRMMYSDDAYNKMDRLDVGVRAFDYRSSLYKKPRFMKHPQDCSLVTYTGHTVLRTLIRCHFSPAATTGQRYIYSGSYDGKIHIWNLEGTVAQVLDRSQTMPLLTRGASSNQIKMNDPSQPDRPPGTYPASGASPVVRDVSWSPLAPVIMSSAWTETGGSVAMHEWKGYGKRHERAD